jgi:hypothetical protein
VCSLKRDGAAGDPRRGHSNLEILGLSKALELRPGILSGGVAVFHQNFGIAPRLAVARSPGKEQ